MGREAYVLNESFLGRASEFLERNRVESSEEQQGCRTNHRLEEKHTKANESGGWRLQAKRMSQYLPEDHDCSEHKGVAVVTCARCRRAFYPDDKSAAMYQQTRNRFVLPHFCDDCQFEIEGIWEKNDDDLQRRLF